MTPLGESLKRERVPDITENGSGVGGGGGYGGMAMGGGGVGMFGVGLSGLMGGGGGMEGIMGGRSNLQMPSPPQPSKPRPDPEITVLLESMGFGTHAAQRAALSVNNKGVTEAQEWAFLHMTDANFNEPIGPNEDLSGKATNSGAAAGVSAAAAATAAGGAAAGAPAASSASAMAAAAPEPPPVVIDEACVAQLMSMGFNENGARRAAAATNSNSEAALEWVFAHMEDADFNEPFPSPAPAPSPLVAAETAAASERAAGEEGDEQELAMPGAPIDALTRASSVKRDAEGTPKPPSPPDLAVAGAALNLPSAPVPDTTAATAAAATAAAAASSTSPRAAGPGQLVFDFSQLLRSTSPPEATSLSPSAAAAATATSSSSPLPLVAPAPAGGGQGSALPNGLDIAAIMAAVTQSSAASANAAGGPSFNAPTPQAAPGASPAPVGPLSTAAAAAAAALPAAVPQVLSVVNEEDTASLLLEMAVAMDEESGANRQLGAAFLYEVNFEVEIAAAIATYYSQRWRAS